MDEKSLREQIKKSGLYLEWAKHTDVPRKEHDEWVDVIFNNAKVYANSLAEQKLFDEFTRGGLSYLQNVRENETVEIPVTWLRSLVLEARKALKFHDGVLQQPKGYEVARLLGYIESVNYLLPGLEPTEKK